MAQSSQSGRFLRVETPLGPDALLLETVSGHETLSRPFELDLELLSEQPVEFDKVLGQRATITIEAPGCPPRRITGVIGEIGQRDEVTGPSGPATFIRYHAKLVPRLWLLTLTRRHRLWQGKSVPEVLTEILRDEWQLDVRLDLAGTYRPRNYCVQYAESDFDFVSRLMETEGIRYHFEHAAAAEVLVLGDRWSQIEPVAAPDPLPYRAGDAGLSTGPAITAWARSQRVGVLKHRLQEHCFEMPAQPIQATAQPDRHAMAGQAAHVLRATYERLVVEDFPCGVAARYDGVGPGGSPTPEQLPHLFDDVEQMAARHAAAGAAQALTIQGGGTAAHLEPGRKFALRRHRDADGEYLVTAVEHEASLEGAYETGAAAPAFSYRNRFRCLPAAMTFYPPRITPRPCVRGPQTATVVGPADQEVFCDRYGRVQVRFHWEQSETASCWIRVAQAWAGKGYGALHVPRVGHEVVVDFQDGDPDRPIIMGSVYNAAQTAPYRLPEEAGQAGLRSQFLGNSGGYSEVCFSDAAGQQGLQLKSLNDLHTIAGNDQHTTVGGGYGIQAGSAINVVIGGGSGAGGGGGWDAFQQSWTAGWSLEAPTGWELYWGDFKQTCLGLGFSLFGSRLDLNLGFTIDLNFGYRYDFVLGAYKQTHFGPSVLYASSETKVVGVSETKVVGVSSQTDVGISYAVTAGQAITLTAVETINLTANLVSLFSPVAVTLSGSLDSKITVTPEDVALMSLMTMDLQSSTLTLTGDAITLSLNDPAVSVSLTPAAFVFQVGTTSLTINTAGITLAVGAATWSLSAAGVIVGQ